MKTTLICTPIKVVLFALFVLVVLFVLPTMRLYAGAEKEMGQERAEYLSERGIVLPAHEARIDELLSAFDFQYPEPEEEFAIYLYSANRLLPADPGRQIIMIGVQARRYGLEALAPLDIILAVDKSGSMAEPDKIEWVKESLEILISTLRDDDRLGLTVFNEQSEVLLPSTRVGEAGFRERFREELQGITPGGGSDLTAGLRGALAEAVEPADGSLDAAAQRVFLLSDGWGKAKGLKNLLAEYREREIPITAVGYGQRFDAASIRIITETTDGTSRFISDRQRMEEVFGSGLGRTTVALVKDIKITVEVPEGNYFRTWGFNYVANYWTNTISYTIPAIHSGDYETILLVSELYGTRRLGVGTLARLTATYRDLEGLEHEVQPIELEVEYALMEDPLSGPSDSRVLLASNLLAYSELLAGVARMGSYSYMSPHSYFFSTWNMRKRLIDTSRRLSYDGFEDEIKVLDNYLHILGEHMGLKKNTVNLLISDDELLPLVADRPLDKHLENLFHEMYLSLETRPPGSIAVADFDVLSGRGVAMPAYLAEAAGVWLSRLMAAGFRIVERRNLDAVLTELEFALSDLVDQENAAKVGMFVSADYLLTGAVMEMEESVVIFSRLINVETAVIETAAQIIVPKEDIAAELL